MPYGQWRAFSSAARRAPVAVPADDAVLIRADRMARFAAGARLIVGRAFAAGGLLAAGWLLTVVFGLLGAAPAAADTTAATGAAGFGVPGPSGPGPSGPDPAVSAPAVSGPAVPGSTVPGSAVSNSAAPGSAAPGQAVQAGVFPTGGGGLSATDNAEAMAGRGVDGLTSQSKPGFPAPATADHSSGANGFVPQSSGGSGPSGPGVGDVTRFVYDPRLAARRVPPECSLPPVVRTAADDPSFSPD
ncbi:hypothetical protein AB0395_42225 [Streptosporangium sp. NPDC051023]|uniref:hypothetical protein n=1 Tax=Streptosporangium sp. NPDC051023 TaxID=3155410 RepID=UPI00344C88F2